MVFAKALNQGITRPNVVIDHAGLVARTEEHKVTDTNIMCKEK